MPFLTNIEIEHYRGFYSRRQIAPAVPNDNNGSGLTVLVGPNNSGKSTVINAIRSVARGPRQIDVEHRHLDHPLVLALTNDSQQKKVITNPDLGATTVLEGELNFFPSDNDIRIVPSSPYISHYLCMIGQICEEACLLFCRRGTPWRLETRECLNDIWLRKSRSGLGGPGGDAAWVARC